MQTVARAVIVAAGCSPVLGATNAPTARFGADDTTTVQADSLYFAASPDKSLALCEGAIAIAPTPALHWRAARARIALGMLSPSGSAERKEHYDSAIAHARRGVKLSPGDVDARYWLAAAAGRRAHRDDPILSTRLGYEVFDIASSILAADSLHAGAHHALGAVHAEVLRAPAFIRFVAARVLRIDVARRANWEDAERHLRRAVDLEPGMIMYAVDLADLYGRAERAADRDSMLVRLDRLHPRHPMDAAVRDACYARWRRLAQLPR